MNGAGYRQAKEYGYANARIKAMKSMLLSSDFIKTIEGLASIKDIEAELMKTAYRIDVEEAIASNEKTMLRILDRAFTLNLARNFEKIRRITPKEHKDLAKALTFRIAAEDLKLLINAKASNKGFESISNEYIPFGKMDKLLAISLLNENGVEEMLSRLANTYEFKGIAEATLKSYKARGKEVDAYVAIDKYYLESINREIKKAKNVSNEAKVILKYRIEEENMLTLLRQAKYNIKSTDYLIEGGLTSMEELSKLSGTSIEEIANNSKYFDIKNAYEQYKKKPLLLPFEEEMERQLFSKSSHTLNHTNLSFAAIISFIFSKQIEISKLRQIVIYKRYEIGKSS
ncbi:MAG: V-type ATPase subunit [Candidatus Micrarchaeia archaeon]